jgi:hypothetical protein
MQRVERAFARGLPSRQHGFKSRTAHSFQFGFCRGTSGGLLEDGRFLLGNGWLFRLPPCAMIQAKHGNLQ